MLRRPQAYADFVAAELGGQRSVRAPIVIVTPYGVGIAGGDRRAVAAVLPRAGGDALAHAATAAVRALARADGHRLPANVPPARLVVSKSPALADATARVDALLVAVPVALTLLLAIVVLEVRLRTRKEAT